MSRATPSPQVTAALALAVVVLTGCEEGAQAPVPGSIEQPPPPVEVARPLVKRIVEWDEYTGRFEAVERVEVRARVSGHLDSVHFRDGQIVAQGDLLFSIDRKPFEALVAGARAELTRAQSALDLADIELKRAERLAETKAISGEDLDLRRATRQQAAAGVAAASAAVQTAELDLAYAEIRSPIAGRISDSRADVGNFISGGTGQGTLLTTIVGLDPIYFVFDASEADFLRYSRLHQQGVRTSSRETPNPVYVRLMDESEWTRRGSMNFVDNEVDLASGTMRGRAIFANPDFFLTPGVFGRLRLLGSGEHEAMLIPDSAIVADQSSKMVMTVDTEGIVIPQAVELGPIVDGLRVVRAGISRETRLIIRGIQRAVPGGKVTPEESVVAPPGGASSPGAAAAG